MIPNGIAMSSREIAELTAKEHKSVLADIRNMLSGLGKTAAAKVAGPNNSSRTIEVFNLPKRETLILVSGYNFKMRAAIIDCWQELDAKEAKPAPSPANMTRLQLIEMAMQAEQERLALECKLAEQAPKVEALERTAEAEGLSNLTVKCADDFFLP